MHSLKIKTKCLTRKYMKEEVSLPSLPIDPIILLKRGAIPGLLAKLSYQDQEKAIEYMRIWGEKQMPISTLHSALENELSTKEIVQ